MIPATSVPIASNTPSVGTPSTTSLTFSGGSDTGFYLTFPIGSPGGVATSPSFNAANPGSAIIGLTTPNGFTVATASTLPVTVVQRDIIPFTGTLGQGLQKVVSISITAPASTTTSTNVTIISNDPSKFLFSATASAIGTASITMAIPKNQTRTPDFYMQATAASGTSGNVTYSVMIPTFTTLNNSPIGLAPTGLRITSPGGTGATSFNSTSPGPAANIIVETGRTSGGGHH